jgi:hypothetical protein
MHNTVFIWKFLDSGSAKKSGVLTQAVINFSLGTENQTRPQKLVKKPDQKLELYLPANENYTKEPL